MSKNSQDEPGEYEVIFDGSNSDSADKTTIEVSDDDAFGTTEYIDAEVDEHADFTKDNQADDQDIEDGIFAPVRKEKAEGKKNASLMWAVSLLAFVGVGAFVYVSNPDILSKVTQNIGNTNDMILPNDTASIEATPDAIDPNLNVADNAPTIHPEEITPDVAADAEHVTPTDVPSDVTATVADPTAQAVVPADVPTAVVTPETLTSEPTPDVSSDTVVATSTTTSDAAPATLSEVSDHATPAEVPAESVMPAVTTADIENIPSSEVITPTNDVSENDVVDTDVPATAKTVSAVAPALESAQAASTQAKNNIVIAEKGNAPVVVNSKEEQKLLDNANLDKYFDSPTGKMLKDIPAPSMNASKGNNESIIVVNKKAQKTKSEYSKPVGKVSIETTSLNSQMVSANRAMKLGRYDAAKEMYDELYKLNPRDGQILSGRAILLQKMGYNDQAISAYEELLSLYPDNTDAIVNLSGLIRKQYPAVALSKLLDLHMKHPNNVAVTAQLGVAYADSGNYADAMRYLSDAARMEPKNALHFYNMAVISEKAAKPDQAISYYEKALEVDSIYGEGNRVVSKERIYDRLGQIRGN